METIYISLKIVLSEQFDHHANINKACTLLPSDASFHRIKYTSCS